jgi:hypothetical protein
MSGKSSEQVAFGIVKGLQPGDRRLVRAWVDATQCDWTTALLNSGVMSGRHHSPEQEARAAAQRESDEALDVFERLMALPDDVTRRREVAEHESAHTVTVEALGGTARVAFLGHDHSGACMFDATGLNPLERAAVAMAGQVWIESFRSLEFPRGAGGCSQDRADAAGTGADLQQARRLAADILRENHGAVLKLADRIDSDGHWFPPSAG